MSIKPPSKIWEAFHQETEDTFTCGGCPEEITVPAKAEGKWLSFNPEVHPQLCAGSLALLNEARDLIAQDGITSV